MNKQFYSMSPVVVGVAIGIGIGTRSIAIPIAIPSKKLLIPVKASFDYLGLWDILIDFSHFECNK